MIDSQLNAAKTILFDHDDTVVRTREVVWAQHKYIAENYFDKILTDDEILAQWGGPLGKLACALYGTDDEPLAMSRIVLTRDMFPKTLLPSAMSALTSLKHGGKLLGIVTATTKANLDYDHRMLGIQGFDYLQTAEDSEYHKPDPRVFEPALKWLANQDVAPHEVIYIGDALHDMHASRDAGLQFIGVTTGLVSAEQFAEHDAVSIAGLHELTVGN